jgi:5-formyltetrahydrofolate cyclo-ligase
VWIVARRKASTLIQVDYVVENVAPKTPPKSDLFYFGCMTSPKDAKKHLRKEALGRRDALDPFWRVEAALEMAETARDRLAVEPGQIVSGFWPMRSEVDVRPLMFALREKGARLCLPAILDKATIVFRELVRGAPMVEMGFGTVGPHEEAEVLDPAVMLVPLAAFDARGHRIGYGAGYYDMTIARLRSIKPLIAAGIAFAAQEVEQVPVTPRDARLDLVLTERDVIDLRGR